MGQGRNPYQAVQNYRSALLRVISCVTPSVIVVRSVEGFRPGSEHRLALGPEEAIKLPGAAVSLSVQIFTRVSEQAGQTSPLDGLTLQLLLCPERAGGP